MRLARLVRYPAQRVQALIFELEPDDRPAAEVNSDLGRAAFDHDGGPAVDHGLRPGGDCRERYKHHEHAADEHHGTPV